MMKDEKKKNSIFFLKSIEFSIGDGRSRPPTKKKINSGNIKKNINKADIHHPIKQNINH